MDELVNFVKEILMLNKNNVMPVGLCSFESTKNKQIKRTPNRRKKELRLSELMNK